jgi:hypothetical protein
MKEEGIQDICDTARGHCHGVPTPRKMTDAFFDSQVVHRPMVRFAKFIVSRVFMEMNVPALVIRNWV